MATKKPSALARALMARRPDLVMRFAESVNGKGYVVVDHEKFDLVCNEARTEFGLNTIIEGYGLLREAAIAMVGQSILATPTELPATEIHYEEEVTLA